MEQQFSGSTLLFLPWRSPSGTEKHKDPQPYIVLVVRVEAEEKIIILALFLLVSTEARFEVVLSVRESLKCSLFSCKILK